MSKTFFNFLSLSVIAAGVCCLINSPAAGQGPQRIAQYISKFPTQFQEIDGIIKFYTIQDTSTILQYDDYKLFELRGTVDFATGREIDNTRTYFIERRGDTIGTFYSSFEDFRGRRMSVDSFTKFELSLAGSFIIPPDSIYGFNALEQDKEVNGTIEKYGLKITHDNMWDSMYYYFSPTPTLVDLSFSPELEKEKGQTLWKVRLLFNEHFYESLQKTLPKREFLFELRNINSPQYEVLLRFLKERVEL